MILKKSKTILTLSVLLLLQIKPFKIYFKYVHIYTIYIPNCSILKRMVIFLKFVMSKYTELEYSKNIYNSMKMLLFDISAPLKYSYFKLYPVP